MAHGRLPGGLPGAAGFASLVILGLLAGSALAKGEVRDMVGRVVAVEPTSQTIVMDVPLGKSTLTVGAEVLGESSITAGKAPRSLSDIKVGDRIRMKWVRKEDKLVVQSIVIQ